MLVTCGDRVRRYVYDVRAGARRVRCVYLGDRLIWPTLSDTVGGVVLDTAGVEGSVDWGYWLHALDAVGLPALPDRQAGGQAGGEAGEGLDLSRALTLMPLGEFDEVRDAFAFDSRVLTLPRADGGVEVSCAPSAPECVRRAAAVGDARGGVDEEQARMMVARISLDMVADNPDVTDAQVTAVFDKAGVYEACGGGDEAVGKERVRAIAAECLARGRGDSRRLGMGAVEPMIAAHLGSAEFAAGREWGRVAGLAPGVKEGEVWDKSDLDEAGRQRWFALYDVYRKYRAEFKPGAAGVPDKDEFEENAGAFHRWYMKEKYGELRRADCAAARDWYGLQVVSRLRERVYETGGGGTGYAGYSGYGGDVQVVRDVLRMLPPESSGADELAEVSRRNEAMEAARSKKFRQRAREDYERLRELRRVTAEGGERAQRERERKAAAERRREERAEREETKRAERAEREEARRLHVARSMPREAEWVWDGRQAADGELPCCAVPREEYERLQSELGFDGSQLVYVQVNGARVQVTGVSGSGRLELNAPAVAKVQKRPNTRRGERWRTGGRLGFSYYFRSAEAR